MSASIRRKTSSISDMKCVAKVTIGEAIEQTSISKDTKESPPHWSETFKMSIVNPTMNAKLEILDVGMSGADLVGETELNIGELVAQGVGSEQNPEFHFKDAVAGNVKFLTGFVDLSKAGIENRQQLVEEQLRVMIEKEKIVVEKEKEQIRKALLKKEEEDRKKKEEEDRLKKEEDDKKKAAQAKKDAENNKESKDPDNTKDSKVSNDTKKVIINPEQLNP